MWVRNRYTGPGGGLYTDPGGGLYTGPDDNPYMSNWPPREYLLKALRQSGQTNIIEFMLNYGFESVKLFL